jgi:cold shock CspA family protein
MKAVEPNGKVVEVPVGETLVGSVFPIYPKFAFIKCDGISYFFVPSAVDRSSGISFRQLTEGVVVEFVAGVGSRGPCAISVRLAPAGTFSPG